MVAEEMPEPVGTEFRLAYDRQNFGMPMPEALQVARRARAAARRAVLRHGRADAARGGRQPVGGARQPRRRSFASGSRSSARCASSPRTRGSPAGCWRCCRRRWALALTLLSPEHMSLLWTDPTGIKMVVVALILQVVGTLDHPQAGGRGVLTPMCQDPLTLALVLVFVAVAVLTGLVASIVAGADVARAAPAARDGGGRRRRRRSALGPVTPDRSPGRGRSGASRRSCPSRRRRWAGCSGGMVRAGFKHPQRAAVLFAAAEIILPVLFALATVAYMGSGARRDVRAAGRRRRLRAARALAGAQDRGSGRSRSRTACPTRSTCSSSASRRAPASMPRS